MSEWKSNQKSTKNMQVTKRDGSKAKFKLDSIRNAIEWAVEGFSVNPLELESRFEINLYEGISTQDIQKNLVESAIALSNIDNPEWKDVAGRLAIWDYNKTVLINRGFLYGGDNFVKSIYLQVIKKRYSKEILESYTTKELKELGDYIDPDRDKVYDIGGAITLTEKYLVVDELIQEAIMVVSALISSGLKERKIQTAKEIYDAVSLKKISLATPILANLRTIGGSASSCFIIGIEDNLESIMQAVTNSAKISKLGGGVGINVSKIRAKGATVNGRPNASKGVTSFNKLFNDVAVAIDQGGKRAGAFTVGLDCYHLDLLDFIASRSEAGDKRTKSFDLFIQVILSNLFMERVENKQDWYLVDPHEVIDVLGIDLAPLYGEDFRDAYDLVEKAITKGELKLFKKVSAREVFKEILKSYLETGLPYLFFKDKVNETNPNKHDGYIPQANLCVTGETQILTKQGYKTISSLAGEKATIWNGKEWSKDVPIFKVADSSELYKIKFSNGETITCTPEHHFWIKKGALNKKRVEAQQLMEGDKLISFRLPKAEEFEYEESLKYENPYTNGVYVDIEKDSSFYSSKISTHKDKVDLKRINYDYISCNGDIVDLTVDAHGVIPFNEITTSDKLEWLAGFLDTKGVIISDKLYIKSANKDLLLDTRLMLHSLGIDTHIITSKGYFYLNIRNQDFLKLKEMGLNLSILNWRQTNTERSSNDINISIVSVKKLQYTDSVYCFTEPKRHMGVLNGVLTGNCTESYSNVKADELAHTCNLVSVNMANTQMDELENICRLAVLLLDLTIDLTKTPIPESEAHNERYRTIGVGVMGLADFVAKNKTTFKDLKFIHDFIERFSLYCIEASTDLSRMVGEKTLGVKDSDFDYFSNYSNQLGIENNSTKRIKKAGSFKAFLGSDWDKGLLTNSRTLKDLTECSQSQDMMDKWVTVWYKIRLYGIRNSMIMAIAPNTTSSLIQGCTASILPVFKRFFYDKSSKGNVPISPPFLKDYFWFYQENVYLNQEIIVEYVSLMNKYIDTGISMELNFNLNEGAIDGKTVTAKDLYDCIMSAWKKGCDAVYYVRSVQKDSLNECTSCAN